ncbi:apolipoprotein M [Silurus meridionalis]|uniref:Apolipoprotein M n=1 Tax=Silurus meridionalis TaxID=175797 RepID=A0A8T0B257_SILME|nr:apolipoprotein M [Silurus meridionalis]KAF7700244.1 hypothetical protein HF521_003202 [Silurus meridionalis]
MVLITLLGLIYAVAQVLVPCLPPAPLSSEVLSTDKYLGKWYYIGVASWKDEDIDSYKSVDNSVAELKKGENNTLIMAAALQQNDQCNNMAWTYQAYPNFGPLMIEGGERYGLFFDGEWIKCSSCLIVAKFHPNTGYLRVMLFARSENTSDDLVNKFKSKMKCGDIIDKFVISPRTKEFCQLEGTG